MKLERIKPRIITIRLTQEESDPDYGSCLWAVFKLDLDRYEISITGDCGNYSCGWHPTPKTESFLHLIGRMDDGYFLDKIASRSRIDQQGTYNCVLQLLEGKGIAIDAIDEDDRDALLAACGSYITDSHGVLSEIRDVLEEMEVSKQVDTFDLCGCIEMDYTPSQKKIAEVFGKYIRPWARSEDQERDGQATAPMNERDADGLSLYLRNLAGSNAGLTNYDRDLLRDASKLIDEFHDALKQERRRRLIADPTEVIKHEADAF